MVHRLGLRGFLLVPLKSSEDSLMHCKFVVVVLSPGLRLSAEEVLHKGFIVV